MSIIKKCKTGKLLQEFPADYTDYRVAPYGWSCHGNGEQLLTVPVVAKAACLQTCSISEELCVLYLPTQKGNLLSGVYDSDIFGIDIRCYPLKEHTKRCLVVPIRGKQLVGLTGKCVCRGCIGESVEKARKQEKDIVKYVQNELIGVINIRTTHAEAVSQDMPGSNDSDLVKDRKPGTCTRKTHRVGRHGDVQ